MIKIGVIGCKGRVNRSLVEEIQKRNDCKLSGVLVRKISENENLPFKLYDNIESLASEVDAIIDFTSPNTSLELAKSLSGNKVILVSGTTGFTDEQFEEFKSYGKSLTIIWSANMSIGINLILSMLKISTPILGKEFDSAIIETHRREKKDRPSGTSKMLSKVIESSGGTKPEIASLRLGESKGDHSIIFSNSEESITFSHNVFSRNTYVAGSVEACKWGIGKKPGFYSMQDVF